MGNTDEKKVENKSYAESAPEFMGAFGKLAAVAAKERPFDEKTAEMIFVAIAIARQCERCIAAHVPLALKAGVTREELIAVINISVLMGGGPASAFGSIALEVYDKAAAERVTA